MVFNPEKRLAFSSRASSAESLQPPASPAGLGLLGAITINICAATILAGWLLFGRLGLPIRGSLLLWGIALLVLVLSTLELRSVRVNPPDD